MASGVGLTRSGHAGSKTFPFRIDVSTSPPPPPSSFVLRYAVITRSHSENRPPLFPSPQLNLTCSALIASLVSAKASLRKVFPLTNPLPFFFRARWRLLLILHVKLPQFPRAFNSWYTNLLEYFETTDPEGASHAFEVMDASRDDPELLSEDITL